MSSSSQQQQSASTKQEELLQALKRGDFDTFSSLLSDSEVQPDYRYGDPHFATALEIACRHREWPPVFVRRLLEVVPPNVCRPRPEPLHYAARSGNVAALQALLSHKKTKAGAQTSRGRTALHWAVLGFGDAPRDGRRADRLEACVRALVDCPALDVNRVDDDGHCALHLAALHQLPRAAAAIIDACRRSRRPLQVDSYLGGRQTARQAVLAWLPQLSDRLPRPADAAAETVHRRLLRAVGDRDVAGYQRLMDAAAGKEGFDPDVWVEQPFNSRLLQHACQLPELTRPRLPQNKEPVTWLGEEKITDLPSPVAELLASKFESFRDKLTSPDEQYEALGGCTCLEVACRHPEVPLQFVQWLLKKSSKPNVNTVEPQPIHYAAKKGNWRALSALLSRPETRVNAADAAGRTALHAAVLALAEARLPPLAADLERCVLLLARCQRLDPDCPDALGFSALHLAAQKRHSRAAAVLIDKCRSAHRSLDADSLVVGGRTARQALAAHLPDLLAELPPPPPPPAERCCWPEGDRQQRAAARAAAAADVTDLAAQFASIALEFGADPTAANLIDNRTPLHVVAAAGNAVIAELLLSHPSQSFPSSKGIGKNKSKPEQEALVNMRDRDGNTALHLAAQFAESADRLDCLRVLLDTKGVAVWLHNAQGDNALEVAGCDEAKDLISKVKTEPFAFPRIYYSAYVRGLFKMLMDYEFSELSATLEGHNRWDLACENYCGYTLIQYAAEKGLYEFVDELVKKVNVNESYDANRRTALMLACIQNDYKMVRLLLEADGVGKIDVSAFDSKKNTALHFAAENGDLEMVVILLKHGADICARNKTGKYPFSVDQLETVLDKNLYSKGNRLPFHRNYVIVFNYRLLVRHKRCSRPTKTLTSRIREFCEAVKARLVAQPHAQPVAQQLAQPVAQTAPALQNEYSEMYFLNCLINSEQYTTLLHHPVISSYLMLKYERAKRLLYFNLVLCVVFATFINVFIGVHISNGDTGEETVTEFSLRLVVTTLVIIMSVRVALHYLLSPLPCYCNSENAVSLLVIVSTTLVLSGWLGSLSVAGLTGAVLLSWLHLFLLTGRHHLFTKNFEMFKTVSTNYLRLLASYIFVIFAFAFSFYILFSHTPVSNQNTSIPLPDNISKLSVDQSLHKNSSKGAENNFFESPTRAVFKTIIMMTGEYDASDLPFGSNFWTGAVVFLLFLFLLPVVLLNLLTALAISNEQRITRSAETLKLVNQVKFLWETEGMVTTALDYLHRHGYSTLAERLETIWVFSKVPPNDVFIEVWPNRVGGTRISLTPDRTYKFKPRIIQNAINILKNRAVTPAELTDERSILSELLKRLESLEDKVQKLNVTLDARTREQEAEESLLRLPA